MSDQSPDRFFLSTAIAALKKYRTLGERAFSQLNDIDFHYQPSVESNSIALLIKHLSGNMLSRWTDFLTTDGEKPTRNRDDEFTVEGESKVQLIEAWNKGWDRLFETLECLNDEDCKRIVTLKGKERTAMEAIITELSHYAYHIGQLIYVAKQIKDDDWQTLSVPRKR